MTGGLALAATASAVLYSVLAAPSVPAPAHSDKTFALSRLAMFRTDAKVSSVQIGPNGKVVVALTSDHGVLAWSIATSQQLVTGIDDTISPAARLFSSPTFDPAGDAFAVMDSDAKTLDTAIDLWMPASGRGPLVQHGNFGGNSSPDSISLGPDDLIAYSSLQTVRLANIGSGRIDGTLAGGGPNFRLSFFGPNQASIVFEPGGRKIAATDGMGTVYLWDVASRHLIAKLLAEKLYNDSWASNPYGSPDIDSIAFSQDGKFLACGSASGIIRVWDVATGRNISTFTVNEEDPSGSAARPVKMLLFSPDDHKLVTADVNGLSGIWDIKSGRQSAALAVRGGKFVSAAFTATGALLVATESSGASGREIEIWTTGKSLWPSS